MNSNIDFYSHTDELKQMKRGFDKMYNSLVALNWSKGGNLGMAWQKALEQMSAFVQNKTQINHPANEYIKQLDKDNRKTMSEYIMKSDFSNDVFKKTGIKDDSAIKDWEKDANKELKAGLKWFNEVYRKNKTPQEARTQSMQNILKMAENKKWLGK